MQMTEKLPNTRIADILARQIIRSATSVGANYRAACRAKSTPDMINKLKIVEEEADEPFIGLKFFKKCHYCQSFPPSPKKVMNYSL